MLALVKDGVVHFIPLQTVHFKLIRTVQIILIYPVHLKVIWAVHLNRCNHLGRKDISFSLPAVMNFVKNDEYFDINLDGILDKWQPDLFQ